MSVARHIPKPKTEPFDAERECLALRAEMEALRADFDEMRGLLTSVRERNREYRRVLAATIRDLKGLEGS